MSDTRYIFENEKVYAIRAGKVAASADSLEELEKVAGPLMGQPEMAAPQPPVHPPAPQGNLVPCPGCGAEVPGQDEVCPHCGTPLASPLGAGIPDPMMAQQAPPALAANTSHIITPDGMKGKLLARTPDIWGEEVTVRLENGRIAHLPVSKVSAAPVEKTASLEKTAAEQLVDRIEAPFEGDRPSLEARLVELDEIREIALRVASQGQDGESLRGIVVTADLEERHVKEALAYLDSFDAERYQPPAPFSIHASESVSAYGLTSGGWLDETVQEMVREASDQDFDRILDEEPQLLVSDLTEYTVADAGAARDMALAHIRPKVAGLDSEIATEIETRFVERVENFRRAAHVARKVDVHQEVAEKTAAVTNLPDDFLFGS